MRSIRLCNLVELLLSRSLSLFWVYTYHFQNINGGFDFALAILTSSGTYDVSFAGDGRQLEDVRGNNDGCRNIELQADGKILAVSNAALGGQPELQVGLRFSLTGGKDYESTASHINTLGGDRAVDAGIQTADQKFLIATDAVCATLQCFGVTRFLPNSPLRDASFGVGGTVRVGWPGIAARVTSMRITTSHIVIGGVLSAAPSEAALVRLDLDGLLDPSFGVAGQRRVAAVPFCADLEVLPDESILVLSRDTVNRFHLLRLLSNGNVDMSFGQNGFATSLQGGTSPVAVGMQRGCFCFFNFSAFPLFCS